MGRGSYAKRLTGQAAGRLPVLKATIPPFHRGIAAEFMAARLEAEADLPASQFTREQAPQRAQAAPISPIVRSEQATTKPVFQPKTDLQEGRSLNPPVRPVADRAEKAEMIEPKETQRALKPGVLKAVGPEISVSASTVNGRIPEGPKINLGIPNFRPGPRRTTQSELQEQEETRESRTALPARTSAERQAAPASFLNVTHAKEPVESATAAALPTKSRVMPSIEPPSVEPHRPSRKSQRSEKSTHELQPRKDPMEKEALAVATQFESRLTPVAAAARGRQEPQTRTAGGVHIGSLEVRIMPPAAPPAPIIKPQQVRPGPATVLSRSFISSLGLSQG